MDWQRLKPPPCEVGYARQTKIRHVLGLRPAAAVRSRLLNIGEHILTVDDVFDIAFFPCIADFKVEDVKAYPDGYIDLCLFNGAIRNSENEEMAQLLRKKSKVLVAFGSCAYEGCIPALSNLTIERRQPGRRLPA